MQVSFEGSLSFPRPLAPIPSCLTSGAATSAHLQSYVASLPRSTISRTHAGLSLAMKVLLLSEI